MANWEIYAGDLYPPIPLVVADSNGPVSLAAGSYSAVDFIASSGGSGHTITGAATVLQVTFTANSTQGSSTLTNVSAYTDLWLPGTPPWGTGSPLYAPSALPLPAGSVTAGWAMPTIGSWNQGSETITLANGVEANASVSGLTIIANIGYAEYVWVSGDTANTGQYTYVTQVTWTSGSKPQTFPSGGIQPLTLQIDPLP